MPDPEMFELLDVARRIFNAHRSGNIDMLRLADEEGSRPGTVSGDQGV